MPDTTVLVIAESRDGVSSPLTRELLGLAQELRGDGGTAALLLARDERAAADLFTHGADRVYFCEAAADEYESEPWAANAASLARELSPAAILLGHTPAGADLAPRLAMRLETAAAMGCVGAAIEAGKLVFTRAAFGGNVRETVSFAASPAVATIKGGVGMADADPSRRGEVIRVAPQALRPRTRVVSRHRDATDTKSLEDAKVIVAGGRGLEGPEGFRVLETLAEVLDGAVGSSRVPCDLGWCPHSWQIGLTGRTVTPDLYFAVGISGAGQHMAGCGNARTIVAINTDPEAAIFKDARFGIVGDYRKVVPALVEALKQQQTS
jgi:electron transfer flavoprotein alpha subunit